MSKKNGKKKAGIDRATIIVNAPPNNKARVGILKNKMRRLKMKNRNLGYNRVAENK